MPQQKRNPYQTSNLDFEMQRLIHRRARFLRYLELAKEAESKPEILLTRHFRVLDATFKGEALEAFDRDIANVQRELDRMELQSEEEERYA